MKFIQKLDKFTEAYIECALWAEKLDHLSRYDLPDDVVAAIAGECYEFQMAGGQLISDDNLDFALHPDYEGLVERKAGHDFYLTRNGHGAGFWDGDWKDEAGKKLTEISKTFGEYYIGFEIPEQWVGKEQDGESMHA